MADEQHTTNADSFATLSEASFAEDWGSKEDRVYDEGEARLKELLKAASPGLWQQQAEFVMSKFYIGPSDDPLIATAERPADAALIALTPGLAAVALRLARALQRWSEIVEDTVNCGSCTDSACETHLMQYEDALTEAAKALADWKQLLGERDG